MKGLVNTQYEDNEYFRWSLSRYLNPVKKTLANLILKK